MKIIDLIQCVIFAGAVGYVIVEAVKAFQEFL